MQHNVLEYSDIIEDYLSKIVPNLKGSYGISNRSVALLLLQKDQEIMEVVREKEANNFGLIEGILAEHSKEEAGSTVMEVSKVQQNIAKDIFNEVAEISNVKEKKIHFDISSFCTRPLTGIPVLLLVLYFGFYKFVGVFGAGTLVNLIEVKLFNEWINPYVNGFVNGIIPWKAVSDLFVNDYGIFTLAIKYAIAIVLPVVGCFFLMFSIIEDSGYLPRISLLMDRVFKKIGLNGRAVIPMTLGFGCDTMATMVSRTLETKRERIITTFLLALAIPCSAQLGVILALLSQRPSALLVWLVFMVIIFMLIGYLTAKVVPGEKSQFYMELPPMRLPKLKNVLKKTYTRMYWYFREVLPLFIFASVLIWLGNLTGVFAWLVGIIQPLVKALDLPQEMASVFLYGFFRRDYGAAGLFDMQNSGILNGRQMVVAAATLTLFIPCVAQFIMMIKERGWKTAVGMAVFILPFAFGAGFILNKLLLLIGLNLG